MSIYILNPDDQTFQPVDQGRTSEYSLLLNILIEQRVTNLLLAQYMGAGEDLNTLRADVVNDPASMKTGS
jgi:hypothetical protein